MPKLQLSKRLQKVIDLFMDVSEVSVNRIFKVVGADQSGALLAVISNVSHALF
jgi:hypothetical protein